MGDAAWRNGLAMVLGVVAGLAAGANRAAAQDPEQARTAPIVVAASAVAAPTTVAHIRPVKSGAYDAAKLLAQAGQVCPTVRALLVAVQQTDVVVMVEVRDKLENGRAFTTMMGSRAGLRWLRVTVDAGQQWRQPGAARPTLSFDRRPPSRSALSRAQGRLPPDHSPSAATLQRKCRPFWQAGLLDRQRRLVMPRAARRLRSCRRGCEARARRGRRCRLRA